MNYLLVLFFGMLVGMCVMRSYRCKTSYNKGYRDCWEGAYKSGYQDAFKMVREAKRK